jgi:hypothetical protein
VYTRLVRLFYANLKVVQDDDRRLVLQSIVGGHTITVDPQIISQFVGVLVLSMSGSPYNEVVIPPSLDDLKEFYHAVSQGEQRAHHHKDRCFICPTPHASQDCSAQPLANC